MSKRDFLPTLNIVTHGELKNLLFKILIGFLHSFSTCTMETCKWTQYVRGIPMPKLPFFPEKNITDAIDYIPKDGDVIICSYPKTGTSWLQFIVQQILSKGQSLPQFSDLVTKIIPFIEKAGIDALDALTEPRIYKHCFSQKVIPIRDNAKYLYIYRNPEDVLISYYHFSADIIQEKLTIDDFMDDFLKGVWWYGDYCDHVMSFLSQSERDNVLVLTYESLISNRKEEVLRLAKFLGEEYYKCLKGDEAILDKIIEHTEFDYMKKNVAFIAPEIPKNNESSELKERKVNFFRKGTVGDGKKSLTETQLKKLREHVASKIKGTHLADKWLGNEQN
ncbi:hypothetical protein JTE90_022386 [Oedothorax gibbosus]|uniref:Sulfotransferase domain-containing protein n=1 Tax=Oedothorax gibbosus TaxID=931172 RepID=A0AAV6UMN8_9ARAC|nr:hypothetical protein JTE90_022386 [Oedothorax gibbosus]